MAHAFGQRFRAFSRPISREQLPTLQPVLLRGVRVVCWTLICVIPVVTAAQMVQQTVYPLRALALNGATIASLGTVLLLSHWRAASRRPEALLFACSATMIASLLFASWCSTNGVNPFAPLAFVVPLALAAFAPVRPTLTLLLGASAMALFPLSIYPVPYPGAVDIWLGSSTTLALAVMGAAASQLQRHVWAELDRERSRAEDARRTAVEQLGLLERYAGDLEVARNAALESTRLKSEFLANMSHEIRTPMTAILGFTEELLDPGVLSSGEDTHRSLETIHRNGEHLLDVINGILDLSKIEAGRLPIEHLRCSPVELLREVMSLMRPRARAGGIDLRVVYRGPLPERIHTDPMRVRQILLNLIGNALKFTEQGSVTVHCGLATAHAVANGRIFFAVEDTGIGLAAGQSDRIFEAFSQADGSTTRRFGGTGLGLTISRRLAQLLGGDISVESEPGQGSCFRVEIATGPLFGVPLVDAPGEAADAAASHTEDPHALHTARLAGRVLVAEDGLDNQRLVSGLLERAGVDVTLADNGRVARDLALDAEREGQPFDLIFMDMQMPELDGYSATQQLREQGYTGPIVALTAHAMAGDREKCLAAGCDDYLPKPLRRGEFMDRAERYLTKAAEER